MNKFIYLLLLLFTFISDTSAYHVTNCSDSNLNTSLYFNETAGVFNNVCGSNSLRWTNTNVNDFTYRTPSWEGNPDDFSILTTDGSGTPFGFLVANSTLCTNNDFSMLFIVNMSTNRESGTNTILFSNNKDAEGKGIYFFVFSGLIRIWAGGAQGAKGSILSTKTVDYNNYTFMIFTYNHSAETGRIWVNATIHKDGDFLVDSSDCNPALISQNAFSGLQTSQNNYAEWALWNTVLDLDRIQTLYSRFRNGTPVVPDTDPPYIQNATLTSGESYNVTYNKTFSMNFSVTDETGVGMLRCGNDSSLNFTTATATRNGTVGSGTDWIWTAPVTDQLSQPDINQSYFCWGNDTLGNVHTLFNLTFNMTLLVDTIAPSFSNNQTNTSAVTTLKSGVQINMTISDVNTGVKQLKLTTNQSGTMTNVSTQTFSGSDNSITVIFNFTVTVNRSVVKWQVWANDSSNTNTSLVRTFTVKNNVPDIPTVYYPVSGQNYSSIPYINYSSTDDDGDILNYTIYINNRFNTSHVNANLTGGWNATDGYYNITVTAFDGINSSANSTVRYFRLDTIAPYWINNQTNASSVELNGNATFNITVSDDGSGLSFYIFSWNGTGEGWRNVSNGSISGSSVKITANHSTNLTRGSVVGYRWYANDSINNWNMSLLRTFTVFGFIKSGNFSINHTEFPEDWEHYSHLQFDLKGDGSSNILKIYLKDDKGVTASQVNNFTLSSTSWITKNVSYRDTTLWDYVGGTFNFSLMNETKFELQYQSEESGDIIIDNLRIYNYTIPATVYSSCEHNYTTALDTSTSSQYLCNISAVQSQFIYLWIDYYYPVWGWDFDIDVSSVKT